MRGLHIDLPKEKIEAFCRKWKVIELCVFGSALRDDFQPDSDPDLLVAFAEDANRGLLEHVEMEEELSAVLGRKVDLVSRRAIEASENYIRRRHILNSAERVYAA